MQDGVAIDGKGKDNDELKQHETEELRRKQLQVSQSISSVKVEFTESWRNRELAFLTLA